MKGSVQELPARLGSYRIEERLAAGGMGVVYRAFDETLQRPLAIKHLLPSHADRAASRRFRREARTAARLNHPAIVHVYDIVETDEGDWIVMELVEGQTLARRIRDGSLDLPLTLRLGREIAEGLAEAHAQGIVHRDLKATNVMVTPSGHAKLLDFGLAKSVRDTSESEISRSGALLGTYHAMSPEQIQGLPVEHRSDLFSLGSLLYEMFTGASPFRAATVNETLARICSLQPLPVCQIRPEVPRDASDLIDHLLCKMASQRPRSADEVARRLSHAERPAPFQDEGRQAGAGHPAAWGRESEPSGETTLVAGMAERQPLVLEPSLHEAPPAHASHRTTSERRQVTVLFCELANVEPGEPSPGQLDPETLYELMLQLRALARSTTSRYGGTLGSIICQRLMVYFGYPQAYEDNACRAVQAALDLGAQVAQMRVVTRDGQPVRLGLRTGIHTGLAVAEAGVRDGSEPLHLGETLDVAIALQALAKADGVIVSPMTRALVQKSFVLETLAPVQIPGQADSIVPQRVLEPVSSREESGVGLVPLVGREREMELLLSRWSLVQEGTGQVALIGGEAGMGKSRLVLALRQHLGESARWLSCYGSPYTQNSPLQPVVDLLRRALARQEGSSPLDQLESLLRPLGLVEALPHLAVLLDVPLDEPHRAPNLPPEQQRKKTLEALVTLTLEMAEPQPLVLLIEDLHWLDPSTLDWLGGLIDQVVTAPLFVVLTLRLHSMEVLWGPRAHLTQITLDPLSDAESATLIDSLAGEELLPPAVRRQIVARTDGVPLFIEELTKALLESGDVDKQKALPATLRDSLTARLDRLGTAKEIAQRASVIGRTFSLELLAAVSPYDETTLQRELKRLVQSELIHRKGFGRQTRYLFKHALVQDAAYESLLKGERQQLHVLIAQAMEGGLLQQEPVQPEVIARHYMAGECFDKAIGFWFEAGRQAIARFAHAEAIEHLQQGLRALEALPPGSERDERELPLQSELVASLGVVWGQASHEVEAVYGRILSLSERVDSVPSEIFFGLWMFYAGCGRLGLARDLGLQRLQRGEEHQDPDAVLVGLYASASSSGFLGDLKGARGGFERLIARSSEVSNRHFASYDFAIASRCLLAEVIWLQGEPDTALRMGDEGVALSRSASPYTQSIALVVRMYFAHSMRDTATALSCARELLALSHEHGYEFWPAHCNMVLGLTGGGDPGAVDIERAVRDTLLCAVGDYLQHSRFRAWAIELCVERGRTELGRSILQEVRAGMERNEERFWEADLERLEGQLLLVEAGGNRERAESCFQRALALARRQGARIFELRAAVCLARLWHGQGRGGEAHEILHPLCLSFTEGRTTPDLVEARKVLAALQP